MRKNKKILCISMIVLALSAIGSLTVGVFAAPSIKNLHGNQETAVIRETSTDGTNTAQVLSKLKIYTNEAVTEQYKSKGADGKTVSTPLSDIIDLGKGTISVTNTNGISIPDKICSVDEMISAYYENAGPENRSEPEIDLKKLDQLTYWQDFKYEETDFRVISGANVSLNNKTIELQNGMIVAEIDGGEITRSADIDDYVIIQIDAASGEVHYLTMKNYDAESGKFTIEFPCIGPYMITQIMD